MCRSMARVAAPINFLNQMIGNFTNIWRHDHYPGLNQEINLWWFKSQHDTYNSPNSYILTRNSTQDASLINMLLNILVASFDLKCVTKQL